MVGWLIQRQSKGGDGDPRERSLWGDLLSLGMVFPLCILLGYLAGRWIGGRFHHPDAGGLVGMAFGIAAAFRELYKTTLRLERLDAQAQAKAQEAGEDPDDNPPAS